MILSELWEANIKAETAYNDKADAKGTMAHTLNAGIPIVVFIGDDELSKGVVSVKNLNSQEQVDVPRGEMIEYVKKVVAENPVLVKKAEEEGKKDK